MWIVKAALKNPYAVAVLALMIVALGIISVVSIPVDILPVFKAPAVQVLTYYPGMPASSVEKTITNRIERWVNQAPGVRRIESKSVPGVSVVKLYFREDIDPNAALTLATSLAQGTLATLPPNTLPPVVFPFDPTGTIPLGILTVSNPRLDEAHVKDIGRIDVRNMLGGIKGAVAPVVVGGKDRTILAYVNPREMWTRKVSPTDVVNALRDGNLMVTPGTAYFGNTQLLLDSNVMVTRVEELNGLPIRMEPGQNVYLRDIGEAEDTYAIQTSRVRIDGKSQVFVPIYRQGGASSLAVSGGVKSERKKMEEKLPPGTKLQYVMDQSGYVAEAIMSLIHEGIFGAALVSIMILIFLGNARMTLIAAMSIPLAILCSIIGLNFISHDTINAMTLGGLALAIGPLVDDAIVVLENTHRHHALGKSKLKAAFDGAVEVTMPVLVATCTTIIVLCPIAFMPGMGGFLFRPLTLAVAFAMIASFLLSRTFVPVLCAKWLGEHHHPGQEHASPGLGKRIYHRIDRGLNFLTRQYERLLAAALRHRLPVLFGIGLLFVGSLGLFFGIGQEFFPQVDAGQITLYVRSPSRFNLKASTEKIARLEKFLEVYIPAREREMILSELGLDPDWSAAYTANSGQQDTVVRIQLNERRTASAQEYAIKLRHLLHDAGENWRTFCGKQDEAARLKLLWAFHKDAEDPVVGRLGFAPLFRTLFQKHLTESRLRQLLERVGSPETAEDRRLREVLRSRSFYRLLNNPRLGELEFSFDTGGMVSNALNYGASSPIDIQIEGGEEQQAMQLARKIQAQVKTVAGAADVRILQRLDAPYLVLEVDREKANEVGLTAADVIKQVVAAMNSSVSLNRNFWIDTKTGNQYFVGVQYKEDPNRKIEDILDGIYASGTGQPKQVALSSLLIHPLHHTKAAVEINHVGLARTFNVLVNTEGRAVGGVAADIQEKLAGIPTPAGMEIKLRGEYARMQQSFQSLGSGLLMASLLVYLLLVGLFRSWLGPFIIMFTVPLGLIGVLTMLFVTGTTLNVQSEMGVIFLVGIVVSNGVLLVDFANKQRKLGASVSKAITTAAAIRFRPILMTFLATFLDLIPMAIGLGRGSEANVPLARAVVGGLLTSTFLTLIVVPILYTLMIRERSGPEIDIDKELEDKDPATAALHP